MDNFEYIGLMTTLEDRKTLIKNIPSKYINFIKDDKNNIKIYLHHITLIHIVDLKKNPNNKEILENISRIIRSGQNMINVTITHIGISDKAIAFKCSSSNLEGICCNKTPHITIGTINDGKPKDSNKITNWVKLPDLNISLRIGEKSGNEIILF